MIFDVGGHLWWCFDRIMIVRINYSGQLECIIITRKLDEAGWLEPTVSAGHPWTLFVRSSQILKLYKHKLCHPFWAGISCWSSCPGEGWQRWHCDEAGTWRMAREGGVAGMGLASCTRLQRSANQMPVFWALTNQRGRDIADLWHLVLEETQRGGSLNQEQSA